MSDLAPFVAATIRDKVVEDLMRENERLREEIRKSKSFRITSYNQQRVFAAGNVEDGHFLSNNSNLWVIPFESYMEQPWKEFRSFEIFCGGAMITSHLNLGDTGFLYFEDEERSDEVASSMRFSFDADQGVIYLKLIIKNWNPEMLRAARQHADVDARRLPSFLRDTLSIQPDLSFEFVEAVVNVNRVLGIIKTISLDDHNARLLASFELRQKMRFQVKLITQAQMDRFNELDFNLGQSLDELVEELEQEGNTDTDSDAFRSAVIQALP